MNNKIKYRNRRTGLFCLLLISLFFGCEKEPSLPKNTQINLNQKFLLVGNEGAFGTNTASLSVINLEENTITNNVYKNINGQGPGDVLQSIERIGNNYYFIINNSDKIIITDTTFKHVGTIANIQSPRYMLPVSNSKAYVTSIYAHKIFIIDLVSHAKIGEIKLDHAWAEQLLLGAKGDYVYVCENDTAVHYITKIEVSTNQIVDKIYIAGAAPSQIKATSDGHLWVLAGNHFLGKVSTLTELNPTAKLIINSYSIENKYTTAQLAVGPNDEKYINVIDYNTNTYGVYKLVKGASFFPKQFFISTPVGANFYGLSVAASGDVFVSDTKGFGQAGDVNRYDGHTGKLLNSWTAGIGPSSFYFEQ